jgi:trimeric autotransporter adhesin
LANGNVGIGTTLPRTKLDISGEIIGNNIAIIGNNNYNYGNIALTDTVNNSRWFIGHKGPDSGANGSFAIDYYNGSSWLSGLWITSSGYVGINKYNPNVSLYVNGKAFIYDDLYISRSKKIQFDGAENGGGALRAYIATNGTDNSLQFGSENYEVMRLYTTTGNLNIRGSLVQNAYSDERLKKNIQSISNALETICKLKGRNFEYKIPKNGKTEDYGFIAQEFQEVFPEWITEGILSKEEQELLGENEKALNFSTPPGLFAYMVEAIKEQQAQINALKAHLNL